MDYFKDTHFAESTCKLYNNKINKWLSYMPTDKNSILDIVMNMEDSVNSLRNNLENTNNSNLHGYYSAIVAFIKYNNAFHQLVPTSRIIQYSIQWDTICKENEDPIRARRLQNKPTVNQEKKGGSHFTLQDIIKKRDSLPFGSIERLLLGFYTYLPPVRADYFSTQIVKLMEKPEEKNYIRLLTPTSSKCVLRDFKTKQTYNRIENDIPIELHKELMESLKSKPRDYLFVNETGLPFTRNAFSIWSKRLLSKVFETEMTLTLLRHIYISSLDFIKMTAEERKVISDKMGHDLKTQILYEWKG